MMMIWALGRRNKAVIWRPVFECLLNYLNDELDSDIQHC